MSHELSAAVYHASLCIAAVGLAAGSALAQPAPLPPKPPVVHTLADAVPDPQGIRRMAVLRGLDKITGRATDIAAPVGVPVPLGSLMITVRFCHTVPPEEPPETTAFLQIDEKRPKEPTATRIFSGWIFASTPALNGLQHPTYDVWVITCKTDEPAVNPPAAIPAAATPAPAVAPAAPVTAPPNR